MFLTRILLASAVLLAGCAGSEPEAPAALPPLALALDADEAARPWAEAVKQDLVRRDTAKRLKFSEEPTLTVRLVEAGSGHAIAEGGYVLAGSAGEYSVAATDALGWQYGAYELIERAGIVLVHPEETIFPAELCVECIGTVNETSRPTYTMRGWHIHTMHPLEHESTLLGNDEALLDRFDNLIGWLIARRQNYIQWALLRTIDDEKWLEYAKKLVRRTHARGMNIGISAPIAFRQQNSFFLYDAKNASVPATTQIAASVAWLMQADWDFINVEMGASEFLSVSDVEQVGWLSFLAKHLDEVYGVRTATKVHCTTNQEAPSYGNMNFNYIVQFADSRMAIMPHTVQFYDLYRPAPTYDREDFIDMREFLLDQIGKRSVYYYPETAYWVTFDNDIPIFLPQYAYARWNDLYRLRDSGMDGQINFSSGLEWGYWMNDFTTAWYAYEPEADYLAPLRRIFSIFGAATEDLLTTFDQYVRWQGDELLVKNGVRWIVSWDAADEIGHLTNIHAQPIATRLFEVADMSPAALDAFETNELPQLRAMRERTQEFADRWAAFADAVPDSSRSIYREIHLAMAITAVRTAYMEELYLAVMAANRGNTLDADVAFARARGQKASALRLVRKQEKTYRFPHEEIAQDRESKTSYPFGYLRTVTDLWYWEREMEMALDPDGYDLLLSLYDLVGSAGL